MKALIEAFARMLETPSGSAQEQYAPFGGSPAPKGLDYGITAKATSLSKVQIIIVGGNNQ